MKNSTAVLFAAFVQFFVVTGSNRIAAEDLDAARFHARQELALAKLNLREYLLVDYPRLRRHLAAEIKLTQAEIASLRQCRARASLFAPRSTPIWLQPLDRDPRICLLAAELRLEDLLAERNSLAQVHAQHWRILEQDVQQARRRVAALEGGAVVRVETASRLQK